MKLFLIVAAVFVALIVFYVVMGRAWLKTVPGLRKFFVWIEPYEIALYSKSETILFAWLKIIVGFLLAAATQAGTIDITPIMPLVPDQWEPTVRVIWNMLPLTVSALGWIDIRLRKDTTKPLELVAVPDNAPPAVAAAVAKVEAQQEKAVEVVAEAKAEGAV